MKSPVDSPTTWAVPRPYNQSVIQLRPLALAATGLVLLTVIALAARHDRPTSQLRLSPAPATPQPGPLAIATVRAHPVTPGPIKIESRLADRDGCRVYDVSFRSDGYLEYALLTEPASNPPTGGYPVLILAHGFIQPAEYSTTGTDYAGFTAAYCAAGFAVLKPDFRGHGRSEGAATGGHFSSGYTYDLLNLTASLSSLDQVNPRSVAWLGHSMGAHVVLRALVASHNLPVKAAVLVSGVVGSLDDIIYHWDVPNPPAGIVAARQQVLAAIGTPAENPGFWHDSAAINYVADIPVPVQIHHGEADSVVPLAFSAHLDAALTAAHRAHEFYTYPGGDHQFSDPASRQLYLQRSIQFLHDRLTS
jgi:dipeptidyl aminopeptidase/acylaminoacyl peptidase